MKELSGGIRAELLKMRHTFLYPLHLAVPVLGAAVFLAYYWFSEKSGLGVISAYIEVIGVVLPFLISVVCTGNVGLEEENHFQVLLGISKYRWENFLTKVVVLAGAGFLSIVAAVFLFEAGYGELLKESSYIQITPTGSLELTLLLFLGSLPLYLEHLFLNLKFSGTVSQCVGVAQFLLSALFLTGLGEGKWIFFPCSWSARGAMLWLCRLYQENGTEINAMEITQTAEICLLLLFFMCVIIGVWFYHYEGRHYND